MARPKKGFNEYKVLNNQDVVFYIINRKGETYEVLISLCDLDKLIKFNRPWFLSWSATSKQNYISACEYLGMVNGKPKYKTYYLERFLTNAKKKTHVDHRNYNPLDNRQVNLRVTDTSSNNKHRKGLNINNTSGYRNVSIINGKPVVQLQVDGKNQVWKGFASVEEAGAFAEEKRKELYGEFSGE